VGYFVNPTAGRGPEVEGAPASMVLHSWQFRSMTETNLAMAHKEVEKSINLIRLNLKWWPPFTEPRLERDGALEVPWNDRTSIHIAANAGVGKKFVAQGSALGGVRE
jgi:hypothetical protein